MSITNLRFGVVKEYLMICGQGVDNPFICLIYKVIGKINKIFYEGLRPCLSITDPQFIRSDSTTPKDPLHTSLFFSKYPEWKRIRAILSPSFTTGKLK
ncbi:unnamed protein product, partial [Oppiella nova]